jgi:hypothetical protein
MCIKLPANFIIPFMSQIPNSAGVPKVKGGLLSKIGSKKIDGVFVEEVRIDALTGSRFLSDIMAHCKNCRKLSILGLVRLGAFDFTGFSKLKSLSIDRMVYTDEFTFGNLEHLSIKAKYEAGSVGPFGSMNISRGNDHVSRHIENIPTLQSLELSTDFYVSRAVLSKLPFYNVLPSTNVFPTLDIPIGRREPYQYLEPIHVIEQQLREVFPSEMWTPPQTKVESSEARKSTKETEKTSKLQKLPTAGGF